MRYILIFIFFPIIAFSIGFDLHDSKKIEVLKHFDIPASFLSDPTLHDIYSKKKLECSLDGFADSSENADIFIPMLSSLIAQSDLPSEFLFVALAESRLNTSSSSVHGAAGLWQFMEQTGKLQGLHIDQYVDERRDHIKSTRAAIAYLSTLKKEFGKWYLALIAYNCGDGRLSRAIRKAGSDDLKVLADPRRGYLPPESRNYIRKVIALAFLGTEDTFLSQYDTVANSDHDNPISTIYLPEGENIDRIAAVLEMPKNKLVKLNTHLKKGITPPNEESYPVYIPKSKLDEFRQKYRTNELKGYFLMHRVKSEDTLARISKRYNISENAIMIENMIADEHDLGEKRYLKIPVNKPSVKMVGFHKAKAGETLASVATLYNLTIEQIKRNNPFTTNLLKEGEEVKIDN
ncbi:MAG: transglycosylase SLT domain-containing protein [Sulfuricurvum sp.]|nr:transglycosylase SLT domain-containing protein [Sulfuricurvum sp.]